MRESGGDLPGGVEGGAMREWVLIATRRAEMSLRTPDVVEFCHEPQPQGAVGVTPNWLKSISPPPHNCGDDFRSPESRRCRQKCLRHVLRGVGGNIATTVLAGGPFRSMEAVFERLHGGIAAVVGYAGGKAEDAQESRVASGRTKHGDRSARAGRGTAASPGHLLIHRWTEAGGTGLHPPDRARACFSDADCDRWYLKRNPNDPHVGENIVPKLKALQGQFPDLLKP